MPYKCDGTQTLSSQYAATVNFVPSSHCRTGSVMERRAITPPVGSPVGRPLYLPPERSILSLDKIAKRECKVLVLDSHS